MSHCRRKLLFWILHGYAHCRQTVGNLNLRKLKYDFYATFRSRKNLVGKEGNLYVGRNLVQRRIETASVVASRVLSHVSRPTSGWSKTTLERDKNKVKVKHLCLLVDLRKTKDALMVIEAHRSFAIKPPKRMMLLLPAPFVILAKDRQ